MNNMIPKRIEEELQNGETLLWWGKPSARIMWDGEKIGLNAVIIFTLFMVLPILSGFGSSLHTFFIVLFVAFIPVGGYFLSWYFHKKNMWFAITDQRAMIVRKRGIMTVSKPLQSIMNFENRPLPKGGTLYLGQYRRSGFYHWFIYEKRWNEYLGYNDLRERRVYDKQNSFCFYSLEDPDTPAAIIRERTSAREYIDPKLKKRV